MAGWRETPWGRRELPGGRICRRLLFSTCRITAAGYWVAFALLALTASQAVAASPNEATTSREARNEAASAIPYGELTEDAQRRIAAVIDKPSAYRRLPIETIECDPSLYIFLIRNPEVVVNIWDLMGVTDLSIQRTGPFTFASSDGV
ncbi:MAG: hypothetical protein KDA60_21225, partial [Planctomycetales bacterium]|nr:hypothetical protein [Planctomycetales bacterium]